MPSEDVPSRRKQRDPAEHRAIPVHRRHIHVFLRREEAEDEEGGEESQRDNVDSHTVTPEREAGWG